MLARAPLGAAVAIGLAVALFACEEFDDDGPLPGFDFDAGSFDAAVPPAPDATVPELPDADAAPPAPPAPPDRWLEFDGTDDVVLVPSVTGATLGAGDFTLEAMVRRPAMSSSVQILLSTRGSGADGFIFGTLDDQVYVQLQGVPNIPAPESPAINTDRWSHVAVTRASGQLKFYVDGVSYDAAIATRDVTITGTAPLRIGYDAVANTGLKGSLRIVRVWSRARSAAELETPLVGSVGAAAQGLVAEWLMSDGEGQTVTESKGAHPGQLGTLPAPEGTDPAWRQ